MPRSAAGARVSGIEPSGPMVRRLREKADEGTIPVVFGLELEQRVADRDGSPFTSDSESSVSVWRSPPAAR